MSRYSVRGKKTGETVNYGLDHVLGWWADRENRKGEEVEEVHTHGPFARPGGKMMIVGKIREWADPEALKIHERNLEAIMLDVDPARMGR